MAKLYFRHGAMGSSKTANALMVEYNYFERGKKALLLKPRIDSRDGANVIKSRSGLEHTCSFVEDFVQMSDAQIREYDCVIVDEAQFCIKSEIEFFLHVVDHLGIPVICYGLRTDFRRELFEGAMWLLAWADVIEEIRTVCWCGQGASCNARIGEDGTLIRSGEQVVLGGNDKYIALCRKHYELGDLGNAWKMQFQSDFVVKEDGEIKLADSVSKEQAEASAITASETTAREAVMATADIVSEPAERVISEAARDITSEEASEAETDFCFRPTAKPVSFAAERIAPLDFSEAAKESGVATATAGVSDYEGASEARKDFEAELQKTLDDLDGEDFDEDEDGVDPNLLAFLDAPNYATKLDVFRKMKRTVDDEMISTMAMALDLEVGKGTLERRIEEMEHCLVTLEKYECNRLR